MMMSIGVGTIQNRAGFADEYPFASHFLDVPGGRYHYVDEGEGSVILCVHGNPTWSFAWRNVIRAFSPRHRVIAVDHMGCGFSDKPQDYPYRLDQHMANLRQLIETLDLQNITLIVHDWGGAIGLGTAGELPERFSRLVVMNTAAFRSQRIPFRIAVCRWPWIGELGVRGFNLFAKGAIHMAVANPRVMTPAVKAGFLAPYGNWEDRVAVHRFVQDIPLSQSHPSYASLVRVESGLSQLTKKPMLLIWGEKDWCFTPEFRKEFQIRFPNAESLILPEAGHYVFEDAKQEIEERLRVFLATPI